MNEGWIKIHRDIRKHWIWGSAKRLQWWIDIILTVNWKDEKVLIGNTLIECKRGQTVRSIGTWAKKWGVAKNTVVEFFSLLEKEQMIVRQAVRPTTILTVCNYEYYQNQENEKSTPTDTQTNHQTDSRTDHQTDYKEEVKEIKEVKKKKKHICDVPEKLQKIEGFNQAWEEWLTYRRERRLTITPTCLAKQLKLLEAREKPIEIINQSITNGWQGLFELKEGFKNANKSANRKLIGRDEYSDGDIFYNNYDQNQPTVQGHEEVQRSRGIPSSEPW